MKQGTDVFKILQGGHVQWRRLPQGHVLTWKGLGGSWRVQTTYLSLQCLHQFWRVKDFSTRLKLLLDAPKGCMSG